MKLVFPPSKIRHYAALYPADEDKVIEDLVPIVKSAGYMTEAQLITLDLWKLPTGRNQHNIEKNEKQQAGIIEDMTGLAFSAKTELGRLRCLLALKGVSISIGSAILHWFHADDYPISDIHARASTQYYESDYTYWLEGWLAYVEFCQKTAKKNSVSMRILDRALFTYSRVHQLHHQTT